MFQSLERDSVCSSSTLQSLTRPTWNSFNLLSEILFVQAVSTSPQLAVVLVFQSLERDSVCSSQGYQQGQDAFMAVSIS